MFLEIDHLLFVPIPYSIQLKFLKTFSGYTLIYNLLLSLDSIFLHLLLPLHVSFSYKFTF